MKDREEIIFYVDDIGISKTYMYPNYMTALENYYRYVYFDARPRMLLHFSMIDEDDE